MSKTLQEQMHERRAERQAEKEQKRDDARKRYHKERRRVATNKEANDQRAKDRKSGKLPPFKKMTDDEKRAKRLARYYKNRDAILLQQHEYYAKNRKRLNKQRRDLHHINQQDPAYRKHKAEKAMEWHNKHKDDPEYREEKSRRTKEWYQNNK